MSKAVMYINPKPSKTVEVYKGRKIKQCSWGLYLPEVKSQRHFSNIKAAKHYIDAPTNGLDR